MARVRKKKVAVVQCLGGCVRQTAAQTADTVGAVTDGKQEKEKNQSQAGTNCQQMIETELITTSCEWGCLGGGSCVEACRLEAIHINDRGTAEVDPEKCVGCGLCAKACPRGLIRITTEEYNIYPACVSEDAGAQTRKNCDTGCIACGICVRNCPMGAISIENNHAVIDEDKCIACGMCAVKCPRGAIRDYNGIFTVREAKV